MKMKSTFIAATLLLVSVMTEGGLSAQNPIVQTCFTTDPAPMVHDGTLYATNDELLYKNVGKAADKSVKDAPYASDMKGKSLFIAINAEAILDLPIVKMVAGFGGQEAKTYIELANKVSYLSMSSEGEVSEIDLCLKDKDVNALKQIVDFAKQFAGM